MTNANHANLRVLMVDDDPLIHEIVGDLLADLGIQQRSHVPSGAEAIKSIGNNAYDLLLCDLQMPEMDGVELMRHIAETGFAGAIILLSGVDTRLRQAAIQVGETLGLNMLGTLEKPVHKKQLEALLDTSQRHSTGVNAAAERVQPITAEELRAGLQSGALVVHFQPKVVAANRELRGAECLARWQHPTRGLLGPQCFIEVAEAESLINEVTVQVLAAGISALHRWHAKGLDVGLAINLSVKHLHDLEFPETLEGMLREAGLSPELVTLEVVETGLLSSHKTGMDILTRLRLKGFGLSVDDFGTGYSTLARIQELPFTEIKIDRSFVSEAPSDGTARAILKSSIALGKRLGLRVVAEGVETEEHWKLVAALGCEEMQGFWIARPITAIDFIPWAANWEAARRELPSAQEPQLVETEEARPRILLIDDDTFVHTMIGDELANEFSVLSTTQPVEGLAMACNSPPDLILLDIDMPGMDGFALCRALRDASETEGIPVIFLSALEEEADRLRAFDSGGSDFIAKPPAAGELKARIRAQLQAKEQLNQSRAMASYASQAAMTAMSSMSEMGTLIQVLQRFNACATPVELADAVVSGIANFDLRGAVALSIDGETLYRNPEGDATALERSVLEHVKTLERIVTFRNRLSIHYDHICLLVTNLPLDQEELCGRLRDHLATLVESANVRAAAIGALRRATRQDAAIDRTTSRLVETLTRIDHAQRQSRASTGVAIQQFKEEALHVLQGMALTESQEIRLMDFMEAGVTSVMDAQISETDTQDKLTAIVEELRRLTAPGA